MRHLVLNPGVLSPLRFIISRALVVMVIVTVLSIPPCIGAGDPVVRTLSSGQGWVNWERLVAKGVGHGVLPGDVENEIEAERIARSAAFMDACRNLLSVLNGICVNGETNVKDLVARSDDLRRAMDGFVRDARVVCKRQLPDRSYEVILQVPITGKGGLISLLESPILEGNTTEARIGEGKYSGLIVDATELAVEPALCPTVLDASGSDVYGCQKVTPSLAVEFGVAAYVSSVGRALKSSRVGRNPLVVKALKSGPRFPTDIILSEEDATRVREADSRSGFLSRCHVVIAIGPNDSGPP